MQEHRTQLPGDHKRRRNVPHHRYGPGCWGRPSAETAPLVRALRAQGVPVSAIARQIGRTPRRVRQLLVWAPTGCSGPIPTHWGRQARQAARTHAARTTTARTTTP